MKQYIKLHFWEWFLCVLTAAGLAINIYKGYDMHDSLSSDLPVVIGIMAVLGAVLFLVTYNRKTTKISLLVMIILTVAVFAYLFVAKPFLQEQDDSLQIFWIYIFLIGIGTFWVTRTKTGSIILFAAGNFIFAAEVFLKFGIDKPGYFLFLFCSAGLIFVRVYISSIKESSVGQVQMGRYFIQIVLVCILAAAAAFLFFWMVIRPLDPPTHELKLITKLESMEVIHKVGVSSILSEINYQRQSDEKPTDQRSVSQSTDNTQKNSNKKSTKSDTSKKDNQKKTDTKKDTSKTNKPDATKKSTDDSIKKDANAIKYNTLDLSWLYWIIGAVAAIIASVLLKKRLRRRWYEKVCQMPRKEGISELYNYFMKTLEKIDVKKQKHLTLREFAKTGRKFTEPYIYGDADFSELTRIYEKIKYGCADASEEDWQKFDGVYQEFFENIYDEIGKWRYLLLFYRL